jgi:hypothetical protein
MTDATIDRIILEIDAEHTPTVVPLPIDAWHLITSRRRLYRAADRINAILARYDRWTDRNSLS